MKKLLTKVLMLAIVAAMALGVMAIATAEEAAPTSSTAWLLYFASNHETDQNNFPWWPQHQRVDQPASETGVEATNAQVTGPGKYTVGLKFNWQKAEGAIQFNLILNDAEVLFPGYYVDITEIRVNGTPIEKKENYYGTYHDDPNAGMVPLYNSYWDPFFTPDATGPSGYRSFDGTPEDATHMVINPDDIVAGDTIEVDFIVAAEAGAAPEELGAMPYVVPEVEAAQPYDGPTADAKLYYQAGGWWPETNGTLGDSTTATITGEGHYTLTAYFMDQGGWTPQGNGAEKLMLVVGDGNASGSVMEGMYLGVSDIRVNGTSIGYGDVAYGPTGYDNGSVFDSNDGYAILYDKWMVENQPGTTPWGHETWNGAAGSTSAVNPDDLKNVTKIEVDFFVTAQQNKVPATSDTKIWYNSNTVGVAGLSLKDLGIAEDWHNIVPVDLTKTGWQRFTLVAADAHEIGDAYVAVNNGSVTVKFEYANGMYIEHSECIKWFTDLSQITAEELTSIEGGLTSADAVNVATDLGGASVAYLSINNKVSFRSPYDNYGGNLPRYWRNAPVWVAYRESLQTLMGE